MLERLSKFLLGYDFFISYAYQDGRDYAAALNDKLTNLDFSCFFDADELPPGEQLPSSLRRAIRKSKVLVLVGTEGTIDAPYVTLEVSYALKQKKIIPIDVDGIRERVTLVELKELPWVNEKPGIIHEAGPSLDVLERTSNYFKFSKRNKITRGIVSAMATVFFIVAVLAVWQWRVAVKQRTIAEYQRDVALSGQLASQSKVVLDKEPVLALLLAAAAGKLSVTFEARDALLRGLQRSPSLVRILHDAGPVRTLAFSPDGTRLASGASKGVINVWDSDTGQRLTAITIPNEKPAQSLAFDEQGEKLIAYGKTEVLAVWRLSPEGPLLESDTSIYKVTPSTEPIEAVKTILEKIEEEGGKTRAFVVTGKKDILATSDGEVIRLWTIKKGQLLGDLAAQERYVRALAFSPKGTLASGSSSGSIALWNVGKPINIGRSFKGLDTSSSSFAFSPDGKQLAGGDYNGDIALWQLDDFSVKRRYLEHGTNVYGLQYGPSNQLVSYGGGELKIWDLGTSQLIRIVSMTMKLASTSAIGPNFKTAALGGNSGEIALWDLETGNQRPEIPNENRSRLTTMAFHPDGNILAAAGNGRNIHLLDVTTGQIVAELDGHSRPISDLDFSGDGSRLASYDSNGTLKVWDTASRALLGRPLQRTESYSGSSAMALSPDGQIAVTSNESGALNFWHVDTWRPLGDPVVAHSDYVTKLEFSPDGNWLVSGGLGGEVFLWDLRIETWIERVCAIANRELTPQERSTYLIDSLNIGGTICR